MSNFIFHGGCVGCTQQSERGVDFCHNCQYFDADWSKKDLSKYLKTPADFERERIKVKYEKNIIKRFIDKIKKLI